MAQIATVMAVNGSGTAVIVDANGNTRPAVAGAPVMRGETVRTTGGARVELMMEDGDVVAINPNQTVRVDENMAQGDARPTPQEGGVASQAIDQVLQALEQGGDLTEELEAAAAGLGGGGGDGEGGGIVQLLRISEGTDGLSYNYNTALTEPNFEFDLDPDLPVNLAFTFGLEEESVASLNGNDETDDGLVSSRSGNFLDGVGGVLTVITVVGLGAVPIVAGGTTVAFDVDGQPIPPGSETPAAVLFTVFPNGQYSLEVVGRLNHPTPGTTEEQLSLPGITITGIAGTGGPLSATVGITVQDDVPELAGGKDGDDGEGAPRVSVTVAENDILTRLSQGTSPNDGNSDGSYTGSPTRFFDSGPANASGSIAALVSFGADGRGENGFSFSEDLGSLVEQGLTSKGEALQYRVEGNTLIAFVGEPRVPSLPGDDDFASQQVMEAGPERVVFTLELQPNGDFAFRLYDQLDHAPGEGNNNLPIEFAAVVVATDGDGDPVQLETGFTVNITDDTPREAGWIPVVRVVEEEALPAGNQELNDIWPDVVSVSGSLSSQVNGGADDGTTYSLNPEGEKPVLTSRGEPVQYRVEGNTLTAFVAATDASAERPVFTLTLSTDGTYTFTLQGQLDHAPGQGENLLSLDLSSFVVATDFDQDSVVLDSALLIKVVDDQPVIEVAKTQHLAESFETFTTRLTGNSWTVVAENGSVVTGNQGIRWTLNEAGIEIQRGNVGDAAPSDGNFKAELDANNNAGGSPNTLTVLSTVLDVPSSTFTMTFDYQPRPADKGDSGMVVSLGGVNVTVSSSAAGVVSVVAPEGVTAVQSAGTGGWTTITLTFSGVTPGLNTLSFQGLSDNANGDTLGALLDNIKLSANNPILVDETQLSEDATSGTAAALFSVSFGADGAAATNSIAYALTARNGTSTGLTDTATGQDVKVLLGTGADAGKVFGVVTEDGAQKVVFVMGVDPVTGMVSFDQQRAVVHPDGSNPNDTVSLAAGVIGLKLTATDADGDPVSAKVDVGRLVSIYDDAPSAAMSGDRIRVDEDGLPGANADAGRTGEVAGTGSTEASGSIVDNVNWGADGFGRVTGVSGGGAVGTPDGSGGFTISNADYTLVVRADGSYTFTLNRAQTHSAEGEDLKALLAEGFTVSAEDKDGDAVPGGINLAVDVQDDIPTVDVASAVQLTLSITNFGETSAGYNNSFGYYIKDAEGKPTTGVIVWDNVKNFTNTSVTITGFTEDQIGFFVIPDGDRLNSSITPDTPVTFQLVAGKWQAFAGGVALTGNGGANVLFDTASLNPNGKSQVQDNAKPGNLNWEDINAGGDNDYDDINIGVQWTSSLPQLQTSDANTVGEASDVAVSTSNFAGSFSFTSSFGADGPGTSTTTYALSVGLGGATGLTQNGVAVVLVLGDDGVLRGFAGDDTPVFSIAVDASGVVTLTQFEQVDHPGEGADGNTANNSAKVVGLPDGLVLLTATREVVDADGDKASDSATIDISESFSFLDDVPVALKDSDTVVDGVAAGNVITAASTTGETGVDDVGADTPATVTGVVQGGSTAALQNGAWVLEGQFGTLVMQTNGQYTYTADPSKTTTVAASADQIGAVNGAAKAFALGDSFFTAGGLYNPAGATGTVSTSGAFLGVAGAPAGQSVPQQINYVGSASEALAFGFGNGVSSATVGFSNLFQNENGGEAARWHAFDAAGNWVGSGVISNNADAPYANTTTTVNFTSNNAGTFTVSNIGVFTTLVLEAVPYAQDGDASNDDSDFFARVVGFQFHPEGEGAYTDTFQYTITDADGDTAQATLTITGERPDAGEPMVNRAPTPEDNSYEVGMDRLAAGNIILDDDDAGGTATGRDWDQDTPVLNLSVYSVIVGGVETVLAGTEKVVPLPNGMLTIRPDGSYDYTANPEATGEGDTFDYRLVDVKGAVTPVDEAATVTLNFPDFNVPPVLTVENLVVSEEALKPLGVLELPADSDDTTVDSATASVTDPNGTTGTTYSLLLPTTSLTSGGVPVVWSLSGDGLTALGKAGADTVLEININSVTGLYTVELKGPLDHHDAAGADDAEGTLNFSFTVKATDSGGLSDQKAVTVTVEDDVPVIGTDAVVVQPGGTASGDTGALMGGDGPGKVAFETIASGDAVRNTDGEQLYLDGEPLFWSVAGDSTVLTAGTAVAPATGVTGFVVTLSADGTFTVSNMSSGVFSTLSDLQAFPAPDDLTRGNDDFYGISDIGSSSIDVLMSARDGAGMSTVNNSTAGFAVGAGQSIGTGEALIFEFVQNLVVAGGSDYLSAVPDGLVEGLVSSFEFTVNRVQGSATAEAKFTVVAYDANGDEVGRESYSEVNGTEITFTADEAFSKVEILGDEGTPTFTVLLGGLSVFEVSDQTLTLPIGITDGDFDSDTGSIQIKIDQTSPPPVTASAAEPVAVPTLSAVATVGEAALQKVVIDSSNAGDTDKGFTVKAFGLNNEAANIGIRTNPVNGGFGVDQAASGDRIEIGESNGRAQKIEVSFDAPVSSVDLKLAWLRGGNGGEKALVQLFAGAFLLSSQTINGLTDTIDDFGTLSAGVPFDRMVFTVPTDNAYTGDDYLVHSIEFVKGTDFPVDITVAHSADFNAVSLNKLVVEVPPGFTLSAGQDNGNGTWTLSSGDAGYTVSDNGNSFSVSGLKLSAAGVPDAAPSLSVLGAEVEDGAGNLLMTGGSGADSLTGGDGNDILIGGAGADTLLGGLGSDTFAFKLADSTPGGVQDVIKDFGQGGADVLNIGDLLSQPGSDVTAVVDAVNTTTTLTFSNSVNGVIQTIVLENFAPDASEVNNLVNALKTDGSYYS